MMYEELINDLRHCADAPAQPGCAANCKYGKEHPLNYWCISVMMQEAADTIEELSKYVNTIMQLKSEGWYLQQYKYRDGYAAVATMPFPESPKEEI